MHTQRRSSVGRPTTADMTVVEAIPFESGWSRFRAALGALAFSPVPGSLFLTGADTAAAAVAPSVIELRAFAGGR